MVALNVDILPSFAHLILLLGFSPCCTCTTFVSLPVKDKFTFFSVKNPPHGCSDSPNGDDSSY